MSDRPLSPHSSDDSDFTLDLDQVFARPIELAPVEPSKTPPPARNHYKLERKQVEPIASYGHFARTSINLPAPDSDPELEETAETPASPNLFGKKKHVQALPELTPNRAYEVMKASSLLNGETMVDPHSFNRGLKVFGLLLMVTLGTFMTIKLIKSTDQIIPDRPTETNSATDRETKITAARQTLQSYLSAKNWKEKAGLILDSERLRPLLSDYYDKFQSKDPQVSISSDGSPQEIGGQFWLQFNLVEAKTNRIIPVRLQETPKGYRLDWEAFVGLGALPWTNFCEQRPTEPTQMRVTLTPLEDYRGAFADSKKFRSYQVTHHFGPPILTGYVERSSRAGQTMEQATAGGTKPASLNLYLQFDPAADPTQVNIIDLVAASAR